jgi:NADPH2:quinone reductase
MKAAVYYRNGGPEVFSYEDVPEPFFGPDEILIRIKSISIEGGDSLNREIRPLKHIPNIVGYQSAGDIIAVGANVRDKKIGQRAVAITRFGSHAEIVAAESKRSFILPDKLSYQEGSATPTAFFTANECLFTFGHLKAAQSILIHGGAGAVGQAAIQLAKRAGATVFTTGADDDKLNRLKELGADHVINYKTQSFDEVILELTNGEGVNIVLDSVGGGKNLNKSINALAYKGIITFIGLSARDNSLFDPTFLWPKNGTIAGVFAPASTDNENIRFRDTVTNILNDVADHKLIVHIDKTFPLSQARDAHQYIQDKKAFGRVLLIP